MQLDGWPESSPAPTAANFQMLQFHVDNAVAMQSFASWHPQHAQIGNLVATSFRSNWAGGIQSDCPGR